MWSSEKTWSFLKGALIAAAGAALTTIGSYAAETDLGIYGPLIGAAVSIAANALRLMAKSEAPAEQTEDDGDGLGRL